ncbi:unnamed protein product [Timema podura]|uniref:Uncharacterized protein n=1 Tax=Timema podura TaxID=61482 RepID=A0ABN7NJN7_TIMPD|nr:unnamed protein product [Timema podura]
MLTNVRVSGDCPSSVGGARMVNDECSVECSAFEGFHLESGLLTRVQGSEHSKRFHTTLQSFVSSSSTITWNLFCNKLRKKFTETSVMFQNLHVHQNIEIPEKECWVAILLRIAYISYSDERAQCDRWTFLAGGIARSASLGDKITVVECLNPRGVHESPTEGIKCDLGGSPHQRVDPLATKQEDEVARPTYPIAPSKRLTMCRQFNNNTSDQYHDA